MIHVGTAGIVSLHCDIRTNKPLWQFLTLSAEKKSLLNASWVSNVERPDIFHEYGSAQLLTGLHIDWPKWNSCMLVNHENKIDLTWAAVSSFSNKVPIGFAKLLMPYMLNTNRAFMIVGYQDCHKANTFTFNNGNIVTKYLPVSATSTGCRLTCNEIDPLSLSLFANIEPSIQYRQFQLPL